jgi:hypothetical protein
MHKEQILEILALYNIPAEDISFRGSDGKTTYFTYQSWRELPSEAFRAISNLVFEDIYEDNDGDGDGGRPIIRRLYTYQLLNN